MEEKKDFNPAVAIMNRNMLPYQPQETPKAENPRKAMADKVPAKTDKAEKPQKEKRNRRFQALFRPSVLNALEYYCRIHKISINEALEQMITTDKHIDSIG